MPREHRCSACFGDEVQKLYLPFPAGEGFVLHVSKTEVGEAFVGGHFMVDASVRIVGVEAARTIGTDDVEALGQSLPCLGCRGVERAGEGACGKAKSAVLGDAAIDLVFKPVGQTVTS